MQKALLCCAFLVLLVASATALKNHEGRDIYFEPAATVFATACNGKPENRATIYSQDLAAVSAITNGLAWIGGWNGDRYNDAYPLAFLPSSLSINGYAGNLLLPAICYGTGPDPEEDETDEKTDLAGKCVLSPSGCPDGWDLRPQIGIGFSLADQTKNIFETQNVPAANLYNFFWTKPLLCCARPASERGCASQVTGLYSIARKCIEPSDELGNVGILVENSKLGSFGVAEIGVAYDAQYTWVYFKGCRYASTRNRQFRRSGGCVFSPDNTCPSGFNLVGQVGVTQNPNFATLFQKGNALSAAPNSDVWVYPYLCCGRVPAR